MPLRRQVQVHVQALPRLADRLHERPRSTLPGMRVIMGTVTEDDFRPYQARVAHRQAGDSDLIARQHRDDRDRLVRELRAEDPKAWTMSRLAEEVGCSKELIAYILRTEGKDAGADPDLPVPEPGA